MKHDVLVCDRQWNITLVLQSSGQTEWSRGTCLKDLVEEADLLETKSGMRDGKQEVCSFGLLEPKRRVCAIVCTYPRHFLLCLVETEKSDELTELMREYLRWTEWAEENLQTAYKDEYYEIQRMNNQLINSQRALTKSNQQLRQVLDEVREANSTIAVLERDELTNLYSASAFYRRGTALLAEQKEEAFDVLVLDVDNFRLVNEVFGRKEGDRLLQEIALMLLGLPGAERGLMARFSADVFYILIPSECAFAETLEQGAADFFKMYRLSVHVREKIGVYRSEGAEDSLEQMCDKARLALNTIETKDEKRIAFYEGTMREKLVMEHNILDRIPDALKYHQFRLYLQPKYDMFTGKVIGAEALIRWIHPEMGFVPPDKFIPLLEKEGAIYEVDRYVWEEACRAMKKWRDMGGMLFPISVNVARGDLYQEDFMEGLQELLKKYDLEAKYLHLEILERAYVEDSANMHQIIEDLRSYGFVIEMDDFGTGESSLAMAAELPVDILKLDRQFLISCSKNKRYESIVRLILNLAKELQIETLAEGVETQEQADFLMSLGCRYAQGYFYGKPQPANELLEKLQAEEMRCL